MAWFVVGLALVLIAEKLWRLACIVRFYRRPIPEATREPELVTILQPVMSGDPTLTENLDRNRAMRTRYRLEWIWITDAADTEARRILNERLGENKRLLVLPSPDASGRPTLKSEKMIAGLPEARGDIVCVLDDDTVLPDFGLEQCVPFLDRPGVGLAFGVPYYVHFANLWSTFLSLFVNASSLLTYIPYPFLVPPFTINGMFYAIRRETLDAVGGFDGLDAMLMDDFAVAHRMRSHGYRLAQTPLRHPLRTHVADAGHYARLMRRWLTSPRETLLRYLTGRDKIVLVSIGLFANLLPLALLIGLLAFPSTAGGIATAAFGLVSVAAFFFLDTVYLGRATPLRAALWLPLVLAALPVQLALAMLLPQRVDWRGQRVVVQRGGGFRFLD